MLQLNGVLEIVIGIVFVWFVMSVVLAGISEGFALATHLRAKHLWLGVGRLVDPAKVSLPRTFADVTIKVPFLSRRDIRPKVVVSEKESLANRWSDRPTKQEPDLEPVRVKTQQVYAAVSPQLAEIAAPGRLSKVTGIAGTVLADAVTTVARRVHPADLTASAVELGWPKAKRDLLATALEDDDPAAELDLDALLARESELTEPDWSALFAAASERLTVRDLAGYLADNPQLAKAVKDAAGAVASNERVTAAKATVERWFDHEMAQISAFYRRQSRKILAVLAIPLVLVLQGNTIALVEDLQHDANLRQAVTSAAVSSAAQESVDTAIQSCEPTSESDDALDQASEQFACASEVIGNANRFRAGWAWQEFKEAHGPTGDEAEAHWNDVGPYLTERWAWLGRPITWIALLFGAQFWFDVLRRLTGIRKGLGEQKGAARQ